MTRPAIMVDELVKRFQIAEQRSEGSRIRWLPTRYDTLEVLRGVTFAIEPGELFGLMGRNGSGKSTLLKIISGVYPADSGTVRIEGRLAPALQLGVGFSPELSAGENAAITAVMLGLSRRDARRGSTRSSTSPICATSPRPGSRTSRRDADATRVRGTDRDRPGPPARRRDPRGRRPGVPGKVHRGVRGLPPPRADDRPRLARHRVDRATL